MLPGIVICDPELTVGLPPFVTAGTGMDALAHCLEAYCAPGYHPLAHPIGTLYDTHHGMTNAIVMPHVLNFNRPAIESRIDRLTGWLGLTGGFDGFMAHLANLRAAAHVPPSLQALGVDDRHAAQVARLAIVDPSAAGNPVPLTEADAHALFRAALDFAN